MIVANALLVVNIAFPMHRIYNHAIDFLSIL